MRKTKDNPKKKKIKICTLFHPQFKEGRREGKRKGGRKEERKEGRKRKEVKVRNT